MRGAGLLLLTAVVALVLACAGTPQDEPIATVTSAPPEVPVVILEASPSPTRTPLPPFNPTPHPNDGQMTAQLNAQCDMGQLGPELSLDYRAEISQGIAEIRRVQILVDRNVTEDSGPIANQFFQRTVSYRSSAHRIHQVELRILLRGVTVPHSYVAVVRCPAPAPQTY